MIAVSQAQEHDVPSIAKIHSEAFPRQQDSVEWISSSIAATPKNLCYLARDGSETIGYIIWAQKAGIRSSAVVELEQIAVAKSSQGRGIGGELIEASLNMLKAKLGENQQIIKSILVTTRADNAAQRLYASTLGAKVEATIGNLYSADEVFMVANVI